MDALTLQWTLLIAFGVGFFLLAPKAKTAVEFFSFSGTAKGRPSVWLLTSSLVISWIFAKSITNAANLGMAFGLIGGVAYAAYYLSFLVAGIIIYQLRVRGGFQSIHHFLRTKFGAAAVIVFSLLIGIRLFNEVWSNTMVIGSYFGESGSLDYYMAILVFTGLTLAYTARGGLRSSLLTDAIQMVFFGVLLVVVLSFILGNSGEADMGGAMFRGEMETAGGLNLLFVALIQIFSYPFHDSVMTDRGFISDPKTTLRSFIYAAGIGFVCLTLFSFVGIFAQTQGATGQAAVAVSKMMGVGAMLAMNFIMITSAASTLDSAFSSFSKLVVVDLGQQTPTVNRGRVIMVVFTLAGTMPVFLNPEILSATTVSGTMVMGLAPVFLLWNR
ncbi:MAG: sodium:solute symporter, partial [Bacteroidota bacterium]